MLQGNKKALKLLSFKAFFVVRGTGLERDSLCFFSFRNLCIA